MTTTHKHVLIFKCQYCPFQGTINIDEFERFINENQRIPKKIDA